MSPHARRPGRRRSGARGRDGELHVLLSRLLSPRADAHACAQPVHERPPHPPTRTEAELEAAFDAEVGAEVGAAVGAQVPAIEWVDPVRDFRIRSHVAPWLGEATSTLCDTRGPCAIDIAVGDAVARRSWVAFFTIGGSTRPAAGAGSRSEVGAAIGTHAGPAGAALVERSARRRGPPGAELYLRVFVHELRSAGGWMTVGLEEPWSLVLDVLGEVARLQHTCGVRYVPGHIVATPDLAPVAAGLPFAGVWLRDGTGTPRRVPPLRRAPGGPAIFLSATFLLASEVRALTGPDRTRAAALLDLGGADDLVWLTRPAII